MKLKLKPGRMFLLAAMVFLSACASNVGLNPAFTESRQSIAQSLEKDKSFADALTQWKILKVAYPNNSHINQQINRLEKIIQLKVEKLQASLKKAEKQKNKSKVRVTNLKILALDPDNAQALRAMRHIEGQVLQYAANDKTANIKKYFAENQANAQQSIQTSQYIGKASALQSFSDRQELLTLSNQILKKYPDFKPALEHKYNVLVSLAESQIAKNDIESAVTFYQQAVKLKDNNNLLSRTTELKNKLSQQYYQNGMKVFKSDLDKAIKLLEASLSYNPKNANAIKQLSRAIKIQKRLNEIRNMSKKK